MSRQVSNGRYHNMTDYQMQVHYNFVNLLKISGYVEQIQECLNLAPTFEYFEGDFLIKNCMAFAILQIGELVKKFSSEYLSSIEDKYDWHGLMGLRDIIAHKFASLDDEKFYNDVKDLIPILGTFISEEIKTTYARPDELTFDNGVKR